MDQEPAPTTEQDAEQDGDAVATGAALADGPLTPEQLAEAQEYARLDLICDLADRAIDLAFLAVMAFLVAAPLDGWLSQWTLLANHDSLRLVALFLITIGLHMALSLPLAYYSGHVIEHRFKMSKLSTRGWLVRYLKRNLLAVAFGVLVFLGLYWLIWLTGGWWWLLAAGAYFVVAVVLGQLAPVLILPLFYKIEPLDEPDLSSRLERLAAGTGLSIAGVYRMLMSSETSKANAMLAGLGSTRRVILGDTLLDGFTPEEIEVIFAHEIGHHVFRHIPKIIVTGVVTSALGFWICDQALMAYVGGAATQHTLPVSTLPLLMLLITLLSILSEPMQNILLRHYERQCDRYALERTGLRAAYISAFQKLARLNKSDPTPHPLAVFLLHSHPPIAERIAAADVAHSPSPTGRGPEYNERRVG